MLEEGDPKNGGHPAYHGRSMRPCDRCLGTLACSIFFQFGAVSALQTPGRQGNHLHPVRRPAGMATSPHDVSNMSEDKANDELVSDDSGSSEGSSGSEEEVRATAP